LGKVHPTDQSLIHSVHSYIHIEYFLPDDADKRPCDPVDHLLPHNNGDTGGDDDPSTSAARKEIN
jgi:hypothetical protein